MQVSITARHLEITEPFKKMVNEKLSRLNRYSDRIEEAHVIFSQESYNLVSEIVLTGKGVRLACVEKDSSIEAAFDRSVSNIEKQFVRFRSKIKDHRVKRFFQGLASIPFSRRQAKTSDITRIIMTESFACKPMSSEEAAMELELFKKSFIVFRDAHTDKVNVLYKRNDGNYGLIQP